MFFKKSSKNKIKIGDSAPDFVLPSQSGKEYKLKDMLSQNLVLYFYPKDNSPGCTAEACAFRDSYEVFKKHGAEVVGISSGSIESHNKFVVKNNLPFILLSDQKGKIADLYGVPTTFGMIPGRVTYLIDKKGIVKYIFSSQINAKKHIDESLKMLKDMNDD